MSEGKFRIIPDADGESFVFENGWDTAIPISFEITGEEGLVVSVFPQVTKIAEEFCRRFAADPTAPAAIDYLLAELSPHMKAWGYEYEPHSDRWGYILQSGKNAKFPENPQISSTFVPKMGDESWNLTTFDLDATISAGCLVRCVAENRKIVALAATHAPCTGDACGEVIEVGVETIPAARGRGLATACLAALCRDITALGATVEYRCQRDNRASLAVARRAGLCEIGRFYYCVGRQVR